MASNHFYIVQCGEKVLLLHCFPTTHGPIGLITYLPQDPLSDLQDPLLLQKLFPASGCLCPAPLYLSELPIIVFLHCRGTSNTELCMLLWLKQTKRISLYKELMLGFLHTQPPSCKDLRAGEVSLAASCGWENWSMRRWNEFAYWMIIPLPDLPPISQPSSWAKALLYNIQPRQRQSQRNTESYDTQSRFFFSFSKTTSMYKRTKEHPKLCNMSEWQLWCLQSFGHSLNVLNNDASKILNQQRVSALTWGEKDECTLWWLLPLKIGLCYCQLEQDSS